MPHFVFPLFFTSVFFSSSGTILPPLSSVEGYVTSREDISVVALLSQHCRRGFSFQLVLLGYLLSVILRLTWSYGTHFIYFFLLELTVLKSFNIYCH